MKVSFPSPSFFARQAAASLGSSPVRLWRGYLAPAARRGLVLLVIASMMISSLPLRADDMMGGGMDGGDYGGYDGGDYGGYDGGDYGGYDPAMIDPGIGGFIDGIIDNFVDPGYDPGYDPGDGGIQIIDDFGIPEDGGDYYPPSYDPPAYSPPSVPRNPAPPRNSPPRSAQPSVPRNSAPPAHRPAPTVESRRKPNSSGSNNPNPPPKPAEPAKNAPAGPDVRPLTSNDIKKAEDATKKASDKMVHELSLNRPTGDDVKKAVDAIGSKLNPDEKKGVQDAIEQGKPDDVRKALEGKGVDKSTVDALAGMANVNKAINDAAAAQAANALTQQQLQQTQQAINNLQQQVAGLNQQLQNLNQQLANANQQLGNLNQQLARQAQQLQQLTNALNRQAAAINNLNRAVNQLIRNQILIALLQRARPGVRAVPPGNGVVIVQVPGMLPPGAVAPMGNGAVMQGPPRRPGQMAGRQPPYTGPSSITTGNVLRAAGMPRAAGSPVRDSKAPITSDIVLMNKGEAQVGFVVDGTTHSLEPSYYQVFRGADSGTVTFDRGTGETAKFTVTKGTYEFTAGDDGWELFRKNYKATIDNSENPNDFELVQGDKKVLVPAGESQQLTSDYPVAVRFDDGLGKVKEKRLMDGNYLVAAADDNGQLDLFKPDQYKAESDANPASALLDLDYGAPAATDAIQLAEAPASEAASEETTPPISYPPALDGRYSPPLPNEDDDEELGGKNFETKLIVDFIEAVAKKEAERNAASPSPATTNPAEINSEAVGNHVMDLIENAAKRDAPKPSPSRKPAPKRPSSAAPSPSTTPAAAR